jgi:hypothetical protein
MTQRRNTFDDRLFQFRSDALQDKSMVRLAGDIPPHKRININATDLVV